jgi:hypothetical protein
MEDESGGGAGELAALETAGLSDREIVFEVWAMLADRSPKRTADLAMSRYGIDVSPGTVSVWRRRHDWDGRARELFALVAPSMIERTAAALVGAGPAAAAYLSRVVAGDPGERLDNGAVDRSRVAAAAAVLDRVGFLPYTRRDAERGGTPVDRGLDTDEYERLSPDELRAAIEARISGA